MSAPETFTHVVGSAGPVTKAVDLSKIKEDMDAMVQSLLAARAAPKAKAPKAEAPKAPNTWARAVAPKAALPPRDVVAEAQDACNAAAPKAVAVRARAIDALHQDPEFLEMMTIFSLRVDQIFHRMVLVCYLFPGKTLCITPQCLMDFVFTEDFPVPAQVQDMERKLFVAMQVAYKRAHYHAALSANDNFVAGMKPSVEVECLWFEDRINFTVTAQALQGEAKTGLNAQGRRLISEVLFAGPMQQIWMQLRATLKPQRSARSLLKHGLAILDWNEETMNVAKAAVALGGKVELPAAYKHGYAAGRTKGSAEALETVKEQIEKYEVLFTASRDESARAAEDRAAAEADRAEVHAAGYTAGYTAGTTAGLIQAYIAATAGPAALPFIPAFAGASFPQLPAAGGAGGF
jgi:hypothetical protein